MIGKRIKNSAGNEPRPKAPPGCYWRGNVLWAKPMVNRKLYPRSLGTDDRAIAQQRQAAFKARLIAIRYGEGKPNIDPATIKPDTPLRRKRPPSEAISPTTPLRLDIAAQLAFPDGSIGVHALRLEARRGNLKIEKIANKQFTTLQDIQEMRERCRNQKPANARFGSSATERGELARAALEATARKLRKNSANC